MMVTFRTDEDVKWIYTSKHSNTQPREKKSRSFVGPNSAKEQVLTGKNLESLVPHSGYRVQHVDTVTSSRGTSNVLILECPNGAHRLDAAFRPLQTWISAHGLMLRPIAWFMVPSMLRYCDWALLAACIPYLLTHCLWNFTPNAHLMTNQSMWHSLWATHSACNQSQKDGTHKQTNNFFGGIFIPFNSTLFWFSSFKTQIPTSKEFFLGSAAIYCLSHQIASNLLVTSK